MVHSKGFVLEKNRTASKRVGDLRHGNQRVAEESHEDGASLDEKTARVRRGIVEQRASDQSLYYHGNLFDEEGSLVSEDNLVLTYHTSFGLCDEADRHGAAIGKLLVLLLTNPLLEQLGSFVGDRRSGIVVLRPHALVDGGLLVLCSKSVCGSWETVLVIGVDLSLGWDSDTSEVVCDVGAMLADEAHALHEGLGFLERTVIDFLAFVEHEDLIEEIVDAVACLVEGDDGGETHYIGHGADGFGVL
jgi:hypothetical protein